MNALIFIIPFILLFLIFRKLTQWRDSILTASVCWGALVVFITELLSIFSLINFKFIFLSWSLTAFVLLLVCLKLNKLNLYKKTISDLDPTSKKEYFGKYLVSLMVLMIINMFMLLVIAVIAAPNNYDSMTYHLSRVLHWIQNNSVAHYPTNITRQLYSGTFAEYVILHLQILTNSDRFANLVQWFSFAGSLIGISLIAKQMGSDIRGQVFSAVFASVLPMAILQAPTTQNNIVVGLWLVCFIYYFLKIIKSDSEKPVLIYACAAGISLGLSFLTKGTAYVISLPFIIWFTLSAFKKFKFNAFKPLLIIGFIPLIINSGLLIRNNEVFSSPFVSKEHAKMLTNQVFTPKSLISGIIKNVSLNLQTPLNDINAKISKLTGKFHELMGISINDSRMNLNNEKFRIAKFSASEDNTGNFIPLLLVLLSICIFFNLKNNENKALMQNYLLLLTAGFILFCFLFKWQPWGARLQLPFFMLISSFAGTVFSRFRNAKIINIFFLLILLSSFSWTSGMDTKRLWGKYSIFKISRNDQYFECLDNKTDYINALRILETKNCSKIGLLSGEDNIEYPLFVILRQKIKQVRVEHIEITNPSKNISSSYYNSFVPCGVINTKKPKLSYVYSRNNLYKKIYTSKMVSVYEFCNVK